MGLFKSVGDISDAIIEVTQVWELLVETVSFFDLSLEPYSVIDNVDVSEKEEDAKLTLSLSAIVPLERTTN